MPAHLDAGSQLRADSCKEVSSIRPDRHYSEYFTISSDAAFVLSEAPPEYSR
jgi:hypothetical protein